MATADDPLERLALRETELREKRAILTSSRGTMRTVLRFFAGIAVAWAIVLALHWAFFASPRWLVLVHTLGFVLVTGYGAAAALFVRVMRKRMPEIYGDV
jgi:hypothetical protein